MWKCCNLITKNEWRTDDRINIRAASWCRSASWEISTPPLRRRWDLALDLWERCNELQQTFNLQQFQHEIRSWGRSLTQVVVGGCQWLSQPLRLIKIRIRIFLLAQRPAVDPLGAGWRRRKAEWREGEGGWWRGRRSLKPRLRDVRGMLSWVWQLSKPLHRYRESGAFQRKLKPLLLLLAKKAERLL